MRVDITGKENIASICIGGGPSVVTGELKRDPLDSLLDSMRACGNYTEQRRDEAIVTQGAETFRSPAIILVNPQGQKAVCLRIEDQIWTSYKVYEYNGD